MTTHAQVEAFRQLLADTLAAGGEFPEPDDWLTVPLTVACHTTGCERDGVEHDVQGGVNLDGEYRIYCGHCTQQMTDITAHLDD